MKKLPFILLLISGAALAIPSAGVLKLFKTAPATEKTKLPFSIRLLEKTLDERVFLSGPHTHQIKKSVNEFGHYNPLFLEKMKVLINQERVPTLAAPASNTLDSANVSMKSSPRDATSSEAPNTLHCLRNAT